MSNLQETQHNDRWKERLGIDSPDRELAIAELRSYLLRGLSCALRSRYGGHDHVEDVVQLALLKILKSLDTFESRCRFTTWAMTVATRIGISELRKRHYRDVSLDAINDQSGFEVEHYNTPGSLDEDSNRVQLFGQLNALIEETLSDKQRAAIRGTLAGLPVEEIASRLSSNRNATYKLIHDAKLRLRQAFEASGVTVEEILATLS